MDFSAEELAALDNDTQQIGIFFRIATDPIARFWLGVGQINPGVNALDDEAVEYPGAGEILGMPDFDQLINGVAQRIEVTASGVSSRVLALASETAPDIAGVACDFGIGIMGTDWQLLGPVHWMRRGFADFLTVSRTSPDDASGETVQTVTLSVGSLATGRRRPQLSYWTDQEQQRRSPGDLFCERTVLYSQGVEKVWPRF